MLKTSDAKPLKMPRRLYFPPLLQFLVYGLVGYLLAVNLPGLGFEFAAVLWASVPIALAGLIVLLVAVRSFARVGTTVNPIEPDKAGKLVTSGLYRFTRNPMYLGMLLVLIGGALALQNIAALAGPALYMISMTRFQIIPEERVLERSFGSAFTAYCQQTRRWL